MRVILQRVVKASVVVETKTISQIGQGFLILLGIEAADGLEDLEWLVGKIAKMRVFEDPDGKMNRSLLEIQGDALVVSQFTLHASTKKGNRPSFIKAARPEHADPFYQQFCNALSSEIQRPVATGSFGANMQVSLVNDGPVTIIVDSRNRE